MTGSTPQTTWLYPAITRAVTALALLLVVPSSELWGQDKGYDTRSNGNQIVVDNSAHWQQWAVAGGTVEITPDGSVGPRFIRKNVNAALNAVDFATDLEGSAFDDGPGGAKAGSNDGEASLLIDGTDASWGPDPDSPLSDWWAEINLGRVVVVNRIVVRFADEEVGDPFLQFKVLAWRHAPPRGAPELWLNGAPDIPKYWELGKTDSPNKGQRVFEFFPDPEAANSYRPPESLIPASESFDGDSIDRIQILATDSDGDRGAEVADALAYDALPADGKGAVDYYRQEPSGRTTRLAGAPGVKPVVEYAGLDPARQGPIRYYRKERPRIAEIEVWTAGDNLALGMLDRGGTVEVEFPAPGLGWKDVTATTVDGRHGTGPSITLFRHFGPTDFVADLGALYWIDTMQFLMDGKDAIDEMSVDISDGTLAADGSIKWTRAAGEVTGLGVGGTGSHFGYSCDHCAGEGALKFRQFDIELSRVRYLRGTIGTLKTDPGGGGVLGTFTGFAEMLLYGEGFVPELFMESDLIELGSSKNLNTIEWEADLDPGTRIEIQTRSGDELHENFLYFDSNGTPVEPVSNPEEAKVKYDKLPKSRKGDIKSFFSPGGDWEPWSAPYKFQGADITSPSPREYMQIRATLLSDDPERSATLHAITVNLSDPVADRIVGEVFPNRVEALGKPHELSLFIRPSFSSASQRFDEIRIDATGGTAMELVDARLGRDEDFANDEATVFAVSELEVMDTADSTMWFRLPDAINQAVDLVEVRFRPTIFSTSTSFKIAVDSRARGFWQRVDAGNAVEELQSETLAVLALAGNEVIDNLAISSPVVTPNGDNVNDVLTFEFTVARISTAREVKLSVFDLSGGGVWEEVLMRTDPRGNYAIAWPGVDQSGMKVPPGIYVARIDVDVDSGSATSTSAHRVVHVAY